MDITLDLIDSVAGPEIVSRGKRYFHKGRVKLATVEDDWVTANVIGSDIYTVELRQEASGFSWSCTCPFDWGGACKHVVATMLAIIYRHAKVTYQPEKLAVNKDALQQQSPGKSKTRWITEVKKLLPAPLATPLKQQKPQLPWRLAYSLVIERDYRRVVPLRIRLLKNGTDGAVTPLKQFDLFHDVHFDLRDRIIVQRIEHGFMNFVPPLRMDDEPWYRGNWKQGNQVFSDLLMMLKGKPLYLAHTYNYTSRPLTISDEVARFRMTLREEDEALSIQAELEWGGESCALPTNLTVITAEPLWVLLDDTLLRVEDVSATELAALQSVQLPLIIPSDDREEFIEEILPRVLERYRVRSDMPSVQTFDAQPIPRLYLKEMNGELVAELKFQYGNIELAPKQTSPEGEEMPMAEILRSGERLVHVLRKPDAEDAATTMLTDSKLAPRAPGLFVPTIHPLEWLLHRLPGLREAGFEIFGQEELKNHRITNARPTLRMTINSGIDWFDMNVDVKFEGNEASLDAFVKAVVKNERFVRLGDGSFGVLPEEWARKFGRTVGLAGSGKNALRFSRLHLGLVDELLAEADELDTDARFDELRRRFQSFTKIQSRPLPDGFRGELRPYQKAGYDWLHFLREFGVGGILADDMGLGKTVQTLVLLQQIYENGEMLPSLIVVPASPLFNWKKEAERFTPTLKVLPYVGLRRHQLLDSFSSYHLIITSYGLMRRDLELLREREFFYVVLDESQNIKNPASVNAKAVRALNTRHRLALTGTPVENNLLELWSQFSFLNPGMLGSEMAFSTHFARPIERSKDEAAASALRKLLYPFILRRTKDLVAPELPAKVESTVYCDMEPAQKAAYEHWREYFRREITKSIEAVGFLRSKMKVLEGLMKLRQVCCHPVLVDAHYKGTAGKFEAFTEMLDDIVAEGHKVLVFSQFVKMLTVLRTYLDGKGVVYEYLDGRTRDRAERVTRFQTDDTVKLFLISLKAGGTGLNLTAADYVIHYDPWWNPAVEAQATDRTHRIGQTKQVFAYKLITRESVEEKILTLQEKKKELVKTIITTDSGFMKSLSKADVLSLFS